MLQSCFAITRANSKLLTGWTKVKQLFGDTMNSGPEVQVSDTRTPLCPLGKEVKLF